MALGLPQAQAQAEADAEGGAVHEKVQLFIGSTRTTKMKNTIGTAPYSTKE